MADSTEALFERYCSFARQEDRFSFALSAPRLLWWNSLRELAETDTAPAEPRGSLLAALTRRLTGRAKPARRAGLAELVQFRQEHLFGPEGWPVGPGPIERLIAAGGSPAKLIAASRGPKLLAAVAPPYLRMLTYRGADLVRTDQWLEGAWLSRCAIETALVWEPDGPIDPDIAEAVLAHLEMATLALAQSLDPSIFTQALGAAASFLDRAERADDRELIGKLCQSIGAMFSGIWTVPGRPQDDASVPLDEWLARAPVEPGIFSGLGAAGSIPGVDESLVTSMAWYRRALPYRRGMHQGLCCKAIVQTQQFRALRGQQIDEAEMRRLHALAVELLARHPEAAYHMTTLASIAQIHGWPMTGPAADLGPADRAVLTKIERAYDPGEDVDPAAPRRRESHAEAVRDLQRAWRHGLPWSLYLRNFDHANEIRLLGDLITRKSEGSTHIVVPEISYSLVDHKIMQLSEEGVLAVCDPKVTLGHRLTVIPMLSLRDTNWLGVVDALIRRCTGIVILLDEVTPGIAAELDLLRTVGAAERTLVVKGHSFRTGKGVLPPSVEASFPHVVDWLDFGYDESHYDDRYKAHRIIQPYLSRYVRANAGPTIRAWLHQSRAA